MRHLCQTWPIFGVLIAASGCYLSHRIPGDGELETSTPEEPSSDPWAWSPRRLAVGGDGHSCFVRDDGRVACWGHNDLGQLGDGTTEDRTTPVDVVGLENVVEIALGVSHSCARRADGTVACWGRNVWGELGDGTRESRSVPRDVAGIQARRLTAGYTSTFVILTDGTVRGWGFNRFGQLGDGTAADRDRPVEVAGLSDVWSVATTLSHTCAGRRDGSVWCWGENVAGQLGDGTTTDRWVPGEVPGLEDVVQMATGYRHACARRADGTVWCWGQNIYGELGDGTVASSLPGSVTFRTEPAPVSGGWLATDIDTTKHHTCVRGRDGALWCWGMVPIPTAPEATPIRIEGLGEVAELAVGAWDNCVLQTDGTIACWGINQFGGAGDGSTDNRDDPVSVSGL